VIGDREILGIHFDDAGFDTARLERKRWKWRKVELPVLEYDPGIPAIEHMRRLLASLEPSRRRRIVVGLPRRHLFLRELSYPKLSETEAIQAARLSISLHAHLDPNEIFFDVGSFTRGGETVVLLGYVKKSFIDPIIKTIREAGHGRSLGPIAPSTLGLDILLRKGKAQFPCTAIGDQNGSAVISLHGVSTWEGSHLVPGFIPGKEREALEAISVGIPPIFAESVSAPRFRVGDLTGLSSSQDPCSLEPLAGLCGPEGRITWGICAAALGISPFPFLSFQEGERKKPLYLRLRPWQIAVALAVVLLLGATGLRWMDVQAKERTYMALEEKIRELERTLAPLEKRKQEADKIRTRFLDVQEFTSDKGIPLKVLLALATDTPSESWIRSLSLKDGKIRISGEGASATETIARWRDNPLFSDVKMVSPVTKGKDQKERFSVELILRPVGEELPASGPETEAGNAQPAAKTPGN